MNNAYRDLSDKIDLFIGKFYKNVLIKGSFIFFGILLISLLLIATIEHFGRFGTIVRGGIFLSFLMLNSVFFYNLIISPFLKLRGVQNGMDRFEAAEMIGIIFPEIADKLLNTLQLHEQAIEAEQIDIILSSIEQRSHQLKSFNFTEGISYNENKKQLRWFLPVLGVLLIIGSFNPSLLFSSTNRILNFTQEFIEPAPYSYSLIQSEKTYYSGDDVRIKVKIKGDIVPEKVYFKDKDGVRLMSKESTNTFELVLPNVQNNLSFSFRSNYDGKEWNSKAFEQAIIGKSSIRKMNLVVSYPEYLGMKNERFTNIADVYLPEGSRIKWSVLTENTSSIRVNNKLYEGNSIAFNVTLKNDLLETFVLENSLTKERDTTVISLACIKDEYPRILVSEKQDSLSPNIKFFSGSVHDDHGLKNLVFNYTVKKKNGESIKKQVKVAPVSGLDYTFRFNVDFLRENVDAEDVITYFFSIFDNDGVNGSKMSRSAIYTYKLPSKEELNEELEETTEATKSAIEQLQKDAEKINERLRKLQKNVLNEKMDSWKSANDLNKIQEDYKELLNQTESLKNQLKEVQDKKSQLSERDEKLLEKQAELESLMEKLLDDELLDMLKELEELMKEQNKEEIKELMDKMELSSEDMEKNMDRSLEALKKLQFEEKLEDIKDKLAELSEKQEELINDNSVEKQEQINADFEQLKDELDELNELNEDLTSPLDLDHLEEDKKETTETLEEAKDNLEKKKEKKSNEAKKNAAEQMEQMSDQLEAMQQQAQNEQQEEDMQALREILERLIKLSLEQEGLRDELTGINLNDPKILTVGKRQRKVLDDTRILADSLNALAVRQPMIAMFIDKELNDLDVNHAIILEDFDERRLESIRTHQQLTMTAYNNLALMLDESLKNMQNQSQKSGSGSCSKPGGKGKPSSGESMESMKEMLKKQLEDMKNGKKPGDKPGDKPGTGKKPGEGMLGLGAKQSAKMAAEQRLMREALEKMRNELNKDGSGSGNKLNPLLEELKKQEEDLINQNQQQLIERQQEILTRLLESEKAIKERDLDDKRESKSGKNVPNSNQIQFEEYTNKKLEQIELIQFVDPRFYKYYKDKASEYLNKSY